MCVVMAGDFPRHVLGRYIQPLPNSKKEKNSNMAYNIPNFLVLHFGENPNKNTKVTDARNVA